MRTILTDSSVQRSQRAVAWSDGSVAWSDGSVASSDGSALAAGYESLVLPAKRLRAVMTASTLTIAQRQSETASGRRLFPSGGLGQHFWEIPSLGEKADVYLDYRLD